MKSLKTLLAMGLAMLLLLALTGCEKRYMVIQQLEQPISEGSTFKVGRIVDNLPADFDPEKKPTVEEMDKFRTQMREAIQERELGSVIDEFDTGVEPDYIIDGALLSYKKGSGAVRFFVGFGLGNSKCEMHLNLVDAKTKQIVFSGAFTAEVGSWAESGDKIFKTVSKDFTKEIEKECKKLREQGVQSKEFNDAT